MANTRHIEISSEYRNRNLYPLPGQFDMLISQSGTKEKIFALDPVSNGSPIIIFDGIFDPSTPLAVFTSGTVSSTVAAPVAGLGNSGSQQKLVATFAAGDLQPTNGFYNGAVMLVTTATTTEHRRIFYYEYVNTTTAIFTLELPFSDAVVNGDAIDIAIPSSNAVSPRMFIPTGSNADNYYVNYILEDVTLGEYRTITYYDGLTHLATLDSPYGGGWVATDSFILRRERPCEVGALSNPVAPNTNTTSFLSLVSNMNFRGDFIRLTSGGNINQIRRIVNYQESISGSFVAGTTTFQFTLPFSFSPLDNFYTGFFITVTSGAAAGDVRLISSYFVTTTNAGVTTRIGTPIANFTAGIAPGDTFTIKGGVVSPALPVAFAAGDTYEILCYTRDNAVPFIYTGSTVSQQEEVCYEIELVDLVLPNQILSVGKGSRITFYPYVYVEFSNISSASAGNKNILYSNNPNSTKMLFRCAIDDVPNPVISPFIKIDGDGTVQTIKFKPNDNLRFSVRLPDGEIFQTTSTETFSPLPANVMMQISALFSIRRL
jgi:hypothetical protein